MNIPEQHAIDVLQKVTGWPNEKIASFLARHKLTIVFKPKEDVKATTTFVFEDVLSKRKHWSEEKAKSFLLWAKKQIQADMIERGWESMDVLLDMYDEELEEQ